jgi:hypothetical protein
VTQESCKEEDLEHPEFAQDLQFSDFYLCSDSAMQIQLTEQLHLLSSMDTSGHLSKYFKLQQPE